MKIPQVLIALMALAASSSAHFRAYSGMLLRNVRLTVSFHSRLTVYKQFKEGQKRILVATDLVGRGIDIERVNIVINYDMPETDDRHGNGADTYLHRVWHHLTLPSQLLLSGLSVLDISLELVSDCRICNSSAVGLMEIPIQLSSDSRHPCFIHCARAVCMSVKSQSS